MAMGALNKQGNFSPANYTYFKEETSTPSTPSYGSKLCTLQIIGQKYLRVLKCRAGKWW